MYSGKYNVDLKFKILAAFTEPTLRRGYENGLTIFNLTSICFQSEKPNSKLIDQTKDCLYRNIKNHNSKYYLPLISINGSGGARHFVPQNITEIQEYKDKREKMLRKMGIAVAVRCDTGEKLLAAPARDEFVKELELKVKKKRE